MCAHIVMNGIIGRYCTLEPYSESNFDDLYKIEMNIDRLKMFSDNPKPLSKGRFADNMNKKLNSYYHSFFVIKSRLMKKSVGCIYSYNLNMNNGYAYASINSCQQDYIKLAIAEGSILFIDYLFTYYNLRKIYADVYSFNQNSIHFLETGGFVQESNLKMHRYYNGSYYDLMTYALYRNSFYELFSNVIHHQKHLRQE